MLAPLRKGNKVSRLAANGQNIFAVLRGRNFRILSLKNVDGLSGYDNNMKNS